MGIIKRNYRKIISYSLIILGAMTIIFVFFFHFSSSYYWCGIFSITVGLTLLSLSGDRI